LRRYWPNRLSCDIASCEFKKYPTKPAN
jgi:hypothetical protein